MWIPIFPAKTPNDPNFTGAQEKGNAIYDQRNRFVLSGFYTAPGNSGAVAVATLGSGLPYNFTTGTTNGGDTGATTDRPVVDGVVVGRNAGRGPCHLQFRSVHRASLCPRSDRVQLDLRAEAFNVFKPMLTLWATVDVGQWSGFRHRLRIAACRHYEPASGTLAAVFGQGDFLILAFDKVAAQNHVPSL